MNTTTFMVEAPQYTFFSVKLFDAFCASTE